MSVTRLSTKRSAVTAKNHINSGHWRDLSAGSSDMGSPGGDFFPDPSIFPNPLAINFDERGDFEKRVFPYAPGRAWMGIIWTGRMVKGLEETDGNGGW